MIMSLTYDTAPRGMGWHPACEYPFGHMKRSGPPLEKGEYKKMKTTNEQREYVANSIKAYAQGKSNLTPNDYSDIIINAFKNTDIRLRDEYPLMFAAVLQDSRAWDLASPRVQEMLKDEYQEKRNTENMNARFLKDDRDWVIKRIGDYAAKRSILTPKNRDMILNALEHTDKELRKDYNLMRSAVSVDSRAWNKGTSKVRALLKDVYLEKRNLERSTLLWSRKIKKEIREDITALAKAPPYLLEIVEFTVVMIAQYATANMYEEHAFDKLPERVSPREYIISFISPAQRKNEFFVTMAIINGARIGDWVDPIVFENNNRLAFLAAIRDASLIKKDWFPKHLLDDKIAIQYIIDVGSLKYMEPGDDLIQYASERLRSDLFFMLHNINYRRIQDSDILQYALKDKMDPVLYRALVKEADDDYDPNDNDLGLSPLIFRRSEVHDSLWNNPRFRLFHDSDDDEEKLIIDYPDELLDNQQELLDEQQELINAPIVYDVRDPAP